MLSSTLRIGLDAYAIGERLHALRMKKKMGLVELGKHTRLSPGLLSKLERGRLYPTLPTLLRVALVFGVGLAQVVVTILAVVLLSVIGGLHWQAGIALGGAVAMSSTAVVSKLLAERLELESGHGREIMGDIKNYTDIAPVMQISEVVVEK